MLLYDPDTDIYISRSLSEWGVWEPFETDLVRGEIGAGATVLDLGANIGYFTLLFAQLVGEQGRVFAFEPDPTNFEILSLNVERNGFQNVLLENKAVSDQPGMSRLFSNQTNRGDYRLYDSGDGRESVEVVTVSLDQYLQGDQREIDFVKMDIQGGELAAVRGMEGLLRGRERLKMITEFWPFGLAKAGGDAAEYLDLLLSLGFRLSRMDEENRRLVPADPDHLLRTYLPEKETFTNLFCTKGNPPVSHL